MSAHPSSKLEAKFQHALNLHQQDKRAKAAKLYRSILKSKPNHPGALHYLGMLSHQEGDSEAAVRLITNALKSQPGNLDAVLNLGNVLQQQENFSEAEECYRKVIEQRPTEAAALSNLSVCLRRQDRLEEAIAIGRKAVEADPNYVIGWFNLGNAYKSSMNFNQAVVCYEQAILLQPDLILAHDALCQSTYQAESRSASGNRSFDKTKESYENWLAIEPDNPLPQFMLQAMSGDVKLTRAPDAVMRSMFDQFAASFEEHLESLDYSLPQKLAPLLLELLGPPQAALNVIDGGCGTGLCAPALKPWARHLTGVDLSGAMLDKAREKQQYDSLSEAELTGFLQHHPGEFDLAVYADTLIYFGDLQEVILASAQALKPKGKLLFTLEASASQNCAIEYQLHPSGRYIHSTDYVQKILQQNGFSEISISPDSMRLEIGNAVPGLVVSARK